jgi:hypothetical protein
MSEDFEVGHMDCGDFEFSLAWKQVWMQTKINIGTIWKSHLNLGNEFPNPAVDYTFPVHLLYITLILHLT